MTPDLPLGFWYDTIDSTMDEARRLIQAGKIQGTAFLVANHQTAGRGTHGRQWSSPEASGIYLSVVHVPPDTAAYETTSLYTLAAGVACVEALKQILGIEAQLKPINDIYVSGKKLGGILVESELQQQGIASLITGIGINTHCVERTLDRNIISPVSLEELMDTEAFATFSNEPLIEAIVAKICFWYALVFDGKHGQVQRAWDRHRISTKIEDQI
jgi:biotin-[acetyl-CoA-carboxylase] ligase BirA-like protein